MTMTEAGGALATTKNAAFHPVSRGARLPSMRGLYCHIQVHVLRGTRYEPALQSKTLPGIDLVELVSFLDRPTASRAIRDYRAALRGA